MDIQIERYKREEEAEFARLIQLCFEEDYLLNIIDSSELKFAYSAYLDNNFAGILIAWTSGFHPYCTYFRILVDPLYNRSNIAENLLNKLEEQNDNELPLQTSIWETSANLKLFYESNGFTEIRRTYMPTLKVWDVKDAGSSNTENYLLKTLSDIISDEFLFDGVAQIVKRNYGQTHGVNPVAEKSLEEWKNMILAEDAVPDGTFIYTDKEEKEIIAYSFLHTSENRKAFELGWCGVNDTKNIGLIPQLVLHQVKHAQEKEIRSIIGEFDTTDFSAMEVLRSLPFAPCPTWITYQKE